LGEINPPQIRTTIYSLNYLATISLGRYSVHSIEIRNSNAFFIIRRSILYSSNGNNGYYGFNYGIYFENVNNSLITENTIFHNYHLHLHAGIRIYNSHNNTIIRNYIKWVGTAIHLEHESGDNKILNNIIVKHDQAFSCIYISSDSQDKNNFISNNYCGLSDPFPQPPTIITSSQTIYNNQLLIQWTAVSGADNYSIYINGKFNTSSINNEKLLFFRYNSSYIITVTAINEYGESEHSLPIIITVETSPSKKVMISGYNLLLIITVITFLLFFLGRRNSKKFLIKAERD